MKFDLIVTRHQGLVDFLIENNLATAETPVITHITDSGILTDKNVIGVLPVALAAKCASFSELDMSGIPVELRGKELTKEQVTEFNRGLFTYKVVSVDKV